MPKLREGFKGQRAIIIPSFIIDNIKKSALGRLLYVTDIGYYPTASYHYRQRDSVQATENIFIYCAKGEGWYKIRNHKFTVSQGSFFVIPANEAHSYGCNEENPWSIYWLHFAGEMASTFASGFEYPTAVSVERGTSGNNLLDLFEEIYRVLDNGFTNNNIMYASSTLFHFFGLLKYSRLIETGNDIQQLDVVDLSIRFMQEKLAQRIKLGEIASEVNLSVSYFSNLFLKKTGYSPLQYLNMLRIRKACQYLDDTNMKINQIAPLVGFDDNFYFSRLFTKIMGISPSQYRSDKKG
ncbi:MAG: AraC family transcriptional regulator [Bacteroidales bacterium]|nr:AraC family transcriptional regulator [Bacteroidales bacterium]